MVDEFRISNDGLSSMSVATSVVIIERLLTYIVMNMTIVPDLKFLITRKEELAQEESRLQSMNMTIVAKERQFVVNLLHELLDLF
jgi:hypothetical protein